MRDLVSRAFLIQTGGRITPAKKLERVPTVSVVIPCYNYGRYLRQCLQSLMTDQPGITLEILIVDDASTDESLKTAYDLQAEYGCVRVIAHPTNRGHIATYNDGLAAATGEFVLLMSADDLATPGALTRSAALLAADESVGMVYGNAIHFVGNPPPSRSDGRAWIVWSGADWLMARCRSGYNVVASPEVMMRTSVLRSIGLYRPDLPHAGDFEMWLRTSAVSNVGFLVGVDQAYYRHHDGNMNTSMFHAGTARGQLIDLQQRWLSFEAVFTGVGSRLKNVEHLAGIARHTIARQALAMVNYAYARGFRDFPVDDFVAFARQVNPQADRMKAGRAYGRRKRAGMMSLALHPLWAPSAVAWRLREEMIKLRRRQVGV